MKDIIFPITYKSDEKGIRQAEGHLAQLGGAVAKIGGAAAAAAGAAGLGLLTGALTSGFARLQSIDNATNKLEGLGHSAESVQTIMDSALASVKGTAYGLGDAANIAASAVAAGIQPGQELTKYLTLTADAASIAGVSLEEMGNTMNNVRTVGAAYNDSLQIVAQKGIPIYQMLADQLGVTTAEVKDLASEGAISADMFETAMRDKFGGAALKAGETVNGAFENMKAALARLGAALLGTTFEGLPEVMGEVTAIFDSLLPQFKEIGELVGPILIDTFRQLMEAIAPLLGPLMEMVVAILPVFTTLITELAPVLQNLIEKLLPLIDPLAEMAITLLPPLVELFGTLIGLLVDNPEFMAEALKGFQDMAKYAKDLANFLGTINDFLLQIGGNKGNLDNIERRARMGQTAASIGVGTASPYLNYSGNWGAPRQATGGITTNGGLSMVGERGPELLNLPTGAQVIPLSKIGNNSGGGSTFNISVNAGMGTDGAALGEQIVTAIRKYERTSGKVFAAA